MESDRRLRRLSISRRYGKDLNILNLAEEHEEETSPIYMTASRLEYYEQSRRYADGGPTLDPPLIEFG